eukprot:SAG22_NODE_17509_length_303_cov_1.250000_1_plen_30_part_10
MAGAAAGGLERRRPCRRRRPIERHLLLGRG